MPYADKQKQKQYQQEYRKKNREKAKQKSLDYRKNNPEYMKNYHKSQDIKDKRIQNWKHYGLKDDPELVYKIYEETNECLICDEKFKNDKDKHMNHCHETGYFLNIICCKCNILEHNDSYWIN